MSETTVSEQRCWIQNCQQRVACSAWGGCIDIAIATAGPQPPAPPPNIVVELTPREFTLVRVALIKRLDQLKGVEHMHTSYEETRALLDRGGKLAINAGLPSHKGAHRGNT